MKILSQSSILERIFIIMLLLFLSNAILTTTINGEKNLTTRSGPISLENDNDDVNENEDTDDIAKLIAKFIVVNGTLCFNKDLVENATAATTNRSDDVSMELVTLDCIFVNSSSSENDTDSEEGPIQDDVMIGLKLLKKLPLLVKKMPSSLLKKLPSLAKSAMKRMRRPKPTKAPKPLVLAVNQWRPLPSPRPTVPTTRPYYYNYPNGHGGSRQNGRSGGGGYGGYGGSGHWSSRRSKNG